MKEIRSVIVILSLSYLSISGLVDNVELFWVNVSAKILIVCTLWDHMLTDHSTCIKLIVLFLHGVFDLDVCLIYLGTLIQNDLNICFTS